MFVYLLILADVCSLNYFAAQRADLAFGHEQVEAVIRDRPEMGVVINREPALRAMLDWSFGGQFRSNRTYWDAREPASGRPASKVLVYVRVTSQASTSAVDKCASLVFELQSLQLDREWESLKNEALAGKINRDFYAVCCINIEFRALTKTREYFANNPLKGAASQDNPWYSSTLANNADFSDYLRWLDGLAPNEFNPRRYYAEVYDEFMAGRGN